MATKMVAAWSADEATAPPFEFYEPVYFTFSLFRLAVLPPLKMKVCSMMKSLARLR